MPEPSTLFGAAALLAFAGYRERRRLKGWVWLVID